MFLHQITSWMGEDLTRLSDTEVADPLCLSRIPETTLPLSKLDFIASNPGVPRNPNQG